MLNTRIISIFCFMLLHPRTFRQLFAADDVQATPPLTPGQHNISSSSADHTEVVGLSSTAATL